MITVIVIINVMIHVTIDAIMIGVLIVVMITVMITVTNAHVFCSMTYAHAFHLHRFHKNNIKIPLSPNVKPPISKGGFSEFPSSSGAARKERALRPGDSDSDGGEVLYCNIRYCTMLYYTILC